MSKRIKKVAFVYFVRSNDRSTPNPNPIDHPRLNQPWQYPSSNQRTLPHTAAAEDQNKSFLFHRLPLQGGKHFIHRPSPTKKNRRMLEIKMAQPPERTSSSPTLGERTRARDAFRNKARQH